MKLGRYAWQTSSLPAPFSGFTGVPTTCHFLCGKVLNCFGFSDVRPQKVSEVVRSIILYHLEELVVSSFGDFIVNNPMEEFDKPKESLLAQSLTARMLISCGCDLILILERAFRGTTDYVREDQIEDAAMEHVSSTQQAVVRDVAELIPQGTFQIGQDLLKLRTGMARIIQKHSNQTRETEKEEKSSQSSGLSQNIGHSGSPRGTRCEGSPRSSPRRGLSGPPQGARSEDSPRSSPRRGPSPKIGHSESPRGSRREGSPRSTRLKELPRPSGGGEEHSTPSGQVREPPRVVHLKERSRSSGL
jgi:hypothetical protein